MSYVKDNFFEFPIKMNDTYSMINAAIEEEEGLKNSGTVKPVHVDWAVSVKVCRPENILGWVECADKSFSIEDILENGFNRTVVTIMEGKETADYECVWERKKFEERFNKRMENKLT